jgi:lipoprotein-anchoring transpeptidase ErfK/SrfK
MPGAYRRAGQRFSGMPVETHYTGGMLRRALRSISVVVGTASVALATSVATGSAADTSPPRVATVSPSSGQVVGVAYPVTVTFTAPVINRRAAERSIGFDSPHTPAGTFTWLSNDVVQWNPQGFWPAHSAISVSAGGAKTNFETGAKVLGVADVDAHTFTVSIDDQVVREMPASMGKPKHPTPIGSFTALQKQSSVVMDSRTIGIPLSDPEGYKLTVADAVRVTWGGVYVHSAPWSVGSQGKANVSHGCINLSPDNAAWYFDTVNIGDPIIVRA